MAGSSKSPTAINPPGTAYNKSFYSANRETTLDLMGVHFTIFPLFFSISPGLISISSPTFKTPFKMEPPTTPPFKLSASSPGLLTSNDLIILRTGGEIKSLWGIGKYSTIY